RPLHGAKQMSDASGVQRGKRVEADRGAGASGPPPSQITPLSGGRYHVAWNGADSTRSLFERAYAKELPRYKEGTRDAAFAYFERNFGGLHRSSSFEIPSMAEIFTALKRESGPFRRYNKREAEKLNNRQTPQKGLKAPTQVVNFAPEVVDVPRA